MKQLTLACYSIESHPVPNAASRVGRCGECGATVWIAYSSPPAACVICMQCFDNVPNPRVLPPTEAQRADIAQHWRKRTQ